MTGSLPHYKLWELTAFHNVTKPQLVRGDVCNIAVISWCDEDVVLVWFVL